MILFFDTSALFKCFHKEIGSENAVSFLESTTDPVYISELTKVEFTSTIHRLFRENKITVEQLQEVITQFENATLDYVVEPINSEVILEAITLINDHAKTVSLRSLDAIQLATFSLIQEQGWAFVTTDNKLASAAAQMGFEVVNPIISVL